MKITNKLLLAALACSVTMVVQAAQLSYNANDRYNNQVNQNTPSATVSEDQLGNPDQINDRRYEDSQKHHGLFRPVFLDNNYADTTLDDVGYKPTCHGITASPRTQQMLKDNSARMPSSRLE